MEKAMGAVENHARPHHQMCNNIDVSAAARERVPCGENTHTHRNMYGKLTLSSSQISAVSPNGANRKYDEPLKSGTW